MARIRGMPMLALLAAAVVIAAAARAEARVPDYHPSTFTVTGQVQCQDCTKNWNAYAYNARPIPGSVVGITCVDDRGRVVYHGSDATDGQGVFNVEVPSKVNGCDLTASRCLVRLASSGDAGCAVPTNFNGGRAGEKPSRLTHFSPDRATYALGPYYYTLPRCDVKDDDAACSSGY
ncbi:hypothetical protein SEVIR_9G340300v4 [Setaria viridis]|uniref:Uncharacterized protein n=1 Tax=Setaria viridis TaxID=4556 RepID=A0A4U6T349_SETVI|nr:pistil-specific extensin-like protein [Setaria viridis]TKV95124.1 hypothetical protein SEVIR_9G340300v2 [Setaria viridis]